MGIRSKDFGDLATAFIRTILKIGENYQRIDLVGDQYRELSIKSETRKLRKKIKVPIRKLVQNGSVPLSVDWGNYLAHPENKIELSIFLMEQLLERVEDKMIVISGAFKDTDDVRSTLPLHETNGLKGNHEEADTRIILHAINCSSNTIVVQARDTDILVLLLAHYNQIGCHDMWLKVGTSKNRKYIPVHNVFNNLPDGSHTSLPSFHALTGSDSTSFIAYHSTQTTFDLFMKHHLLLDGLGKHIDPPSQDVLNAVEKFVCHIYMVPHAISVDNARALLSGHCKNTEAIPPTSDALNLYLMRVHYQSLIWNLAHIPKPNIPESHMYGMEGTGQHAGTFVNDGGSHSRGLPISHFMPV